MSKHDKVFWSNIKPWDSDKTYKSYRSSDKGKMNDIWRNQGNCHEGGMSKLTLSRGRICLHGKKERAYPRKDKASVKKMPN